jgi:predicted dienelactone hydrolase
MGASASLTFFKQQVMVSAQRHRSVARTSVRMKAPTRLFPFFNHFSEVVVVTHQNAFPFFQFNTPSNSIETAIILIF